jgi:nucleoside-diphosphate-sugar epimerase
VTINGLVDMVAQAAGKRISIKHIPGPMGVRGRNSDNRLIKRQLGWAPSAPLRQGIERTYNWIDQQVGRNSRKAA